MKGSVKMMKSLRRWLIQPHTLRAFNWNALNKVEGGDYMAVFTLCLALIGALIVYPIRVFMYIVWLISHSIYRLIGDDLLFKEEWGFSLLLSLSIGLLGFMTGFFGLIEFLKWICGILYL